MGDCEVLFFRCIFVFWVGLLLLFGFAAVRGCFLLGTGVEDALLSEDSAGQPVASQISGRRALPVTHSPTSEGDDLSVGFAPRVFQ